MKNISYKTQLLHFLPPLPTELKSIEEAQCDFIMIL